ncbi:ABC transporter substrate-binding protein [Nocardia rhamnosiphila]
MAAVLVLAGCSRSGEGGGEGGDIKVAYVGDITGANAMLGEQGAVGFEDGIAAINESGGVDGREIVVEKFDSQTDANAAQTAWRNAFATNPTAIYFSGLSSTFTAGYPTMLQRKLPVLAASSIPEAYGQDWFFSAYAEPDASARILVEAAKKFLGGDLTGKRVALVGSNTPAVVQQRPFAEQAVEEYGGKLVAAEFSESGIASFATQAQKIAAAKPDAVVTLEAGNQVVVTKDLVTAGITGPIIGTVGGASTAQLEAINAPNFIGLRDVVAVEPGTELYDVVEKRGSREKATSTYYVYGYAFATVLAAGLGACGADCGPEELAKAIHELGDLEVPNYVAPLNFEGTGSGVSSEVPFVWNPDKKAAEPAGDPIGVPGR